MRVLVFVENEWWTEQLINFFEAISEIKYIKKLYDSILIEIGEYSIEIIEGMRTTKGYRADLVLNLIHSGDTKLVQDFHRQCVLPIMYNQWRGES